MTKFQEELGGKIIAIFKENDGKFNLFTIIAPKLDVQNEQGMSYINSQLDIVKDELKDREYIKPFQNSQITQMCRLTEKGWNFKNFVEENKKYKREEYMKKNAYWRAKYWWLIMLAGAALGWASKFIGLKG